MTNKISARNQIISRKILIGLIVVLWAIALILCVFSLREGPPTTSGSVQLLILAGLSIGALFDLVKSRPSNEAQIKACPSQPQSDRK